MICPKCGFSQPEELYCAKCGINVVRDARRRKRRLHAYLLLFLFASSTALALALFNGSTKKGQPGKTEVKDRRTAVGGPIRKGARPVKGETGVEQTKAAPIQPPATAVPSPSRDPQSAAEGGSTETGTKEGPPKGPASEQSMTAAQWFEAGRALNDDSAEEITCYRDAIRVDPKFAPAYYALGGIYFRQAEYDQADKVFSEFLRYASEEDRQANDIYVYYTPREVDDLIRLSKGEDQGGGTQKGEKTQGKEAPKTEGEKGGNSPRELKTVVGFKSLGGHIGVNVQLNHTLEARMLLDTGAGVTLLSRKTASELGILPLKRTGSVRLKTIGQDVEVPLAKLEMIRLGGVQRADFSVAVSDLNLADRFDGILGMDFLREFDIWINNRSGEIVLTGKKDE